MNDVLNNDLYVSFIMQSQWWPLPKLAALSEEYLWLFSVHDIKVMLAFMQRNKLLNSIIDYYLEKKMKKLKTKMIKVFAVSIFTASFGVSAHLNIAADNIFALGDEPRDYIEGKTAYIEVNAVEGCEDADDNKYPITDVVVILPNSPGALSDNFLMKSRGSEYGANAVMFTRGRISSNWKKINVVKGPVDSYFRDRTEGVRAIKWLRGNVAPGQYDNLEFRTRLPNINSSSCIGKLRVEVPTITYCKRGFVRAWIGTEGTARFPADSDKLQLDEEYELYFNVVRDVENNPYPESCLKDDDGNVVPDEETVRPSDAAIDLYGGRSL